MDVIHECLCDFFSTEKQERYLELMCHIKPTKIHTNLNILTQNQYVIDVTAR